MKKTIVRVRRKGSPAPALQPSAGRPLCPSPRSSPGSGGSNAPVLVTVVAVLVVMVVVGVIISSNSTEEPIPVTTMLSPVPTPAAEEPRPKKWDQLNGMTMAEWMKENNKDNKALQEREERVRKLRSGPKE